MESLSNKILLNICTIKEFAVGLQFCVVSKFLSSRGTFERLLVKGKAKGHYTPLTMSPTAPPPQEFNKHTRACLRCKLVKTFDQFLTDGCENCDTLNLKNNTELVSQSTTNEYSGVISLIDPKASWASKWLRLGQSKPGCYALEIHSLKSTKI